MTTLAVGIAGIGGRGRSFTSAIAAHEHAHLHAICDVDPDALVAATEELGIEHAYEDVETMLASADLDVLVVATPMPYHVDHSIEALERDVHVLCEVPAGVSIEECKDLVAAASDSAATYAMAENYVYHRPNQLVTRLVKEGFFGEVYYAEAEYIHELKELNEITRWRRTWQTGVDGNTYPTHSLGPVLQWFGGDRIERVTCAGSGHHYRDPRGELYEQQDTTVTLGETASGRLVKLRLDMLSERPHAANNYQLQGSEGAYESARGPDEQDKVWLDAFESAGSSGEYTWRHLEEFTEYLPERWQDPSDAVQEAGHGGSDFIMTTEYLGAIAGGDPPPIGVHEAMDMTLPGLVSQASIADGAAWHPVPDSREWG